MNNFSRVTLWKLDGGTCLKDFWATWDKKRRRDALTRGSTVFCNKCVKDNPAESEFCIHCGTRSVQPMSVIGYVSSADARILMRRSIV